MMFREQNASDVEASWPSGFRVYANPPNRYFESELDEAGLASLLSSISSLGPLSADDRTCALFGFGSQTRDLYRTLGDTSGLDVVWRGDFGPWWLRPLTFIAAAHGGLIRVRDTGAVPEALTPLAHLAMVELYSFKSELWQRVEEYVLRAQWRSFIGLMIAREDPSYFCLGVDGDDPDVAGYKVWCTFGPECPAALERIVNAEDGV